MEDKDQGQKRDGEFEESGALEPVKGKRKKILSTGVKIVIGGAVTVFIISFLTPRRTMGMTRSARLQYEQRKSEAETAFAEEMKEEGKMVADDE